MKWLMCFLGLVCVSSATLPVRQADISKLLDPTTRLAETKRLRGDKGERWQLAGVRFIACPQKNGKPLYLLMTKTSYDTSGREPSGLSPEYSKKEAKGLFKKEGIEPNSETGIDLPNTEVISGWALAFFKANGTEIHPFGGNNYISKGYIFDLNKDGILDCVDSTNWGVGDGMSVKTLSVKTIEEKPTKLLDVLYEWHPNKADESNEWSYRVTDEDKNGLAEVSFGPRGEKSEINYFWDTEKKEFLGPDGQIGDHFKRLKPGSFQAVKQSGGLGYALKKSKKEELIDEELATRKEVIARKLHPLPDFKTMSFDQTIEFFTEEKASRHADPRDIPTVFPEALKTMPVKEATLAYVKANMSEKLARSFALAVDDRNGVKPPDKGWMVFKQNSASCYHYVRWCWAVNIEKNLLVYISDNINGMVGHNSLVDEVGYSVRMMQLKPAETNRIVGTLWWLNQIRSKELPVNGNHQGSSMMSSSADGNCSLFYSRGENVNSLYSDMTCWMAYSSFHERWKDDYDKEVSANFASKYLEGYLPELLGERWTENSAHRTKDLSKQEQEDQLKDEMDQLRKKIADILELNKNTTVPAEVLAWSCRIAGDLGMKEFLPEIKRLKSEAKPPLMLSQQTKKLAGELQGKEEPYFPKRGSEEAILKEKFRKLKILRLELSQNADQILSEQLSMPIKQLSLIDDVEQLLLLSISKDREADWAQQQLRKKFPNDHAFSLAQIVKQALVPIKRQQALDLLISLYPETALDLVLQLKDHEKEAVCLSILPLYQKLVPKQVDELLPMILKVASNPEAGWQQGLAVSCLIPENFPNEEANIYPQLLNIAEVSIAKNPGVYNPLPHTEAIISLSKWPKAREQWEEVFALAEPNIGTYDYQQIEENLLELSIDIGGKARKVMAKRLEAGMINSGGFMRGRINTLFKKDFRECLPVIERLATASPQEPEHERANMSQGSSFPTGRYSYHAARYTRPLWADYDDETRAKVWAGMALRGASLFIEKIDRDSEKTVWELTAAGKHFVTHIKQSPDMKLAFLQKVDADRMNEESPLGKLATFLR